MKDKERLRKLIRIFFILLIVLAVLEFLSIGFNGVGFFTSLYVILPLWWPVFLEHIPIYRQYAIFMAALVALVLLYCTVVPFLVLFFSKCNCYFSLWYACRRRHYPFKICRFPFRSLAGVRETPDIKIEMGENTLYVHFMDIHYASRRLITFSSEKEYLLHPIDFESMVFRGKKISFRQEGYRLRRKKYPQRPEKIKQLPEFSRTPSEYHVLVLMPGSVTAQVAENRELVGVGGETWYRGLMICRARVLKRRLRGELLTPFGPPEQK